MDDLTRLLKESFEYETAKIHTLFPAVVESYDAKARRADVRPSLRRKLPDGTFADLPIISDVPVLFSGTKKYTISFPLEKGDEVLCCVIERATDAWRDAGGAEIEDEDPRRFSLMDCVAIPGLQSVDFIPAEGEGLCVVHRSGTEGDFISSVVIDDRKIEARFKDAAAVLVEDRHIKATAGAGTLEMKGDKLGFKNESKDVFTVLSKILEDAADAVKNAYSMKTVGSPAQHAVSPDDIAKLTKSEADLKQDKSDLGEVMEAL